MSEKEQGAADRDNSQKTQKASNSRPTTHVLRADLDEVQQILFGMRLAVASLRRALAQNPRRMPELLDSIQHQTEAAVEAIRRL